MKNKFIREINKNKLLLAVVVLSFPWALYFTLLYFFNNGNSTNIVINISGYGNQLDFAAIFSGCFTFSSVIFLWLTLIYQQEQNEKQAVENHFYKMLEIVRDNSESMNSKNKKGRPVFKLICDDFDEIYRIIDNYCCGYTGNQKKPSSSEKIAVSWLIVFYGLDEKVLPVLKRDIARISQLISNEDKFHIEELNVLLNNHKNQKSLNKSLPKECRLWLEFDGYQSMLAHYFRHLFQTVQYVNTQTILKYEDKYHYIRTLRAQLNTFELMVLFYNCFSPYGKEWEPNRYDISGKDCCDKADFINYYKMVKQCRDKFDKLVNVDFCLNEQLITKYQFFRNITMPLNSRLKLENFFPMIEYESDAGNKDHMNEREKLEKYYN